MKSIAIFNNKGGVGKTTLLCNLVAYLALASKKKILVIDADPQCNATQAFFPESDIEDFYDTGNYFTIYNVIEPLSLGKGYSEQLQIQRSEAFGVDVVLGDPRLALTEDLLAQDWKSASAGDARGLRTTFLFQQLLTLCSEYDYVFFDMGPSLGSINRSVLIAADFFVSPMAIDIFSLKAIENISVSLKKWQSTLENGLKLNDHPDELPSGTHGWSIRFAGYVTQQYTAKVDKSGERRAVAAYERIMKRIPAVINQEFVQKLQPDQKLRTYELGTVPNLHSLIPMSQNSRKPVFELKAKDGVVGAHFTKVRDARDIFKTIALRFEKNLATLGKSQ